MSAAGPRPLVGLTCCRNEIKQSIYHVVGEKYITAVLGGADALPLLIPALGADLPIDDLLDRLDGLLLTGSPSNVEPYHYKGAPSREGTLHDPDRDATTLPLIREAVRRNLPVLAICRGIQELNVALGGTLHQRIGERPGGEVHRRGRDIKRIMEMTMDERYGPCHPVQLTPGGFFATLAGTTEIMVNSLHGQGIDRPAPGLRVDAVAPDGLIEAVSMPGARFVVGVQWHPEYKPLDNPVSRALFAGFGAACRSVRSTPSAKRRAA